MSRMNSRKCPATRCSADRSTGDPAVWTPTSSWLPSRRPGSRWLAHFRERRDQNCVNAGSKGDRSWLAKVRPMSVHYYHFHVRYLSSRGQRLHATTAAHRKRGLAPADLAYWFTDPVFPPAVLDAIETSADTLSAIAGCLSAHPVCRLELRIVLELSQCQSRPRHKPRSQCLT